MVQNIKAANNSLPAVPSTAGVSSALDGKNKTVHTRLLLPIVLYHMELLRR